MVTKDQKLLQKTKNGYKKGNEQKYKIRLKMSQNGLKRPQKRVQLHHLINASNDTLRQFLKHSMIMANLTYYKYLEDLTSCIMSITQKI